MPSTDFWYFLDRLGLLPVIGTGLIWTIGKVRGLVQMIAEDRRKITALWREHGYGDWDGVERRRERRD